MPTGEQRRRRPRLTVTTMPLPRRLADHALTYRWRATDLARPPAGSGLRPVPGDRGLPVLGHGLEWLRFGPRYERARYERYGPVSWMKAFGVRIVTVGGPEATQLVLTNKDKEFSSTGWELFFSPFFRRGLLLLDFDEHRLHRRIMQQAFTRERLSGYLEITASTVRSGIGSWPERGLRLYPALKRLTLDIAGRVFLATALDDDQRIIRAFVDALGATTALVRFPVPGGRWQAGLRGRRVLDEYLRDRIPALRAGGGDDLFSALAHARDESGRNFSDEDVVNHVIFLLLAAHDTSTTAATAVMYFLARHPEWQELARAESLALDGDLLDIDALDRLSTLDLVIKESLRLVAPIPAYVRRTVTDTDLLGYYLPAGTTTLVMSAISHSEPKCWSDPDTFDPERFAEPRREDRSHRYAWVPFGGGAHKCIGMHFSLLEIKTILHEMLRRYEWRLPAGYRITWDWANVPQPVDGLPLELTCRAGARPAAPGR